MPRKMLPTTLLVLLCLTFVALASAQNLRKINVINTILDTQKIHVVYMTADWCAPCLKKLPDMMKNLTGHSDYDLKVVFQGSKVVDSNLLAKLYARYDPALFYQMADDYNAARKIGFELDGQFPYLPHFIFTPGLGPKNFADDFNRVFETHYKPEQLNWGNVLVSNGRMLKVINESDVNKLIAAIQNTVHELQR